MGCRVEGGGVSSNASEARLRHGTANSLKPVRKLTFSHSPPVVFAPSAAAAAAEAEAGLSRNAARTCSTRLRSCSIDISPSPFSPSCVVVVVVVARAPGPTCACAWPAAAADRPAALPASRAPSSVLAYERRTACACASISATYACIGSDALALGGSPPAAPPVPVPVPEPEPEPDAEVEDEGWTKVDVERMLASAWIERRKVGTSSKAACEEGGARVGGAVGVAVGVAVGAGAGAVGLAGMLLDCGCD